PGNIGAEPSEVNQREFYRFWLEVMSDRSWPLWAGQGQRVRGEEEGEHRANAPRG
ncbi:MAG: hypothetical protein QOC62_524, partial [Mycobacterium sp.]|nr:hypothetical protein [Mycobacterium sp.]